MVIILGVSEKQLLQEIALANTWFLYSVSVASEGKGFLYASVYMMLQNQLKDF